MPKEVARQECQPVPREVCADVTKTGKTCDLNTINFGIVKHLSWYFLSTECRTESRQIPKEQCEIVPKESCSESTEVVCEPAEPICRVEVKQVPKEECKTVVVQKCAPVQREECRDV